MHCSLRMLRSTGQVCAVAQSLSMRLLWSAEGDARLLRLVFVIIRAKSSCESGSKAEGSCMRHIRQPTARTALKGLHMFLTSQGVLHTSIS